MIRGVLIILFIATFVGAMMPSRQSSPDAENGTFSELSPPESWGSGEPEVQQSTSGGGTIRLSRRPDGHFYADVKVNGRTINFLVDTGASGVALAYDDAKRAGIDVDRSDFYVAARAHRVR